ncbi:DUF2059 domain-containing protein [Xylella taiwanensis]|uniref:DUF2059 domain-containing protein n=1 Tax=Xylella taiwanensis TaxID=1444770 RepID=Z9JKB5_9GAMM|nr:DUF2059 domain-containing protein [Xylella taiwanensis]AXI82629.1 hypothetical protein AB672_00890 [Xylella taiwanensis]EWS78276.1 hypothetical protein AF72_06045 [Xylella taiwanensis]MCD8455625.1 DUF2059 domain-containing protein [Xylella taiwanensis]MCD8458032.1 DUF2059 domain-containing protein [Xylella taiwanensis]MCD8460168.1 DUF2059 domain-containing protein [Xylella taiwanensis]
MPTFHRLRCFTLFIAMSMAMPLATAAPPSDADVNRLLSASRAQSVLDSMLPQIEAMQQKQFDQIAAGHTLNTAQKAKLAQIHERTKQAIRKTLSWSELQPLYTDLYKRSFSREDVIAMAEFYESPAGQTLLDKTPALMQNLMVAIQKKMAPLMDDLLQDFDQIANTPKQDHRK